MGTRLNSATVAPLWASDPAWLEITKTVVPLSVLTDGKESLCRM